MTLDKELINIDNKLKYNIEIEKSKDNRDILKILTQNKSIYLGSKYSVTRDIDNLEKFVIDNSGKNIIIIGLATGEYIKEINNYVKSDNKIIILEPNIEVYNLYIKDNEDSFENIIVLPLSSEYIDLIDLHISSIALDTFRIYEYPNYRNIYIQEIYEIYNIIRNSTRQKIIDRNTNIFFSRIWFESTVSGLKYLEKSKAINNVKGIYEDRPAIIVSAGPSLAKNIKKLKEFEDKAIIFTGGRTLKALKEENIEPDFLSIIDAQELSYELVDGIIEKSNTILAHSEIIPNKVLKKHKGNRLFYPYSPWIKELVNDPKYNFTHSSVAHTCTKLAIYMGCNPIIFIGQDLAYTDNKVHAENAEFTQEKHKEKEDISKVVSEFDIYVKDIYGNPIRTSMSLDLFRQQFEEIIKENKEIKFINSTEGGANIEGTEVKNLLENKEVFNRISKKSQININFGDMNGVLDKNNVCSILDSSVKYLEEIIDMLNDAIKHNEKYYNHYISKGKILKSSIKVLDEADILIKNIPNSIKFIQYLFAETINTVLYDPTYKIKDADSELKKANIIYKKSKILYGNILEEAEYALNYIKKEKKEIEQGDM